MTCQDELGIRVHLSHLLYELLDGWEQLLGAGIVACMDFAVPTEREVDLEAETIGDPVYGLLIVRTLEAYHDRLDVWAVRHEARVACVVEGRRVLGLHDGTVEACPL